MNIGSGKRIKMLLQALFVLLLVNSPLLAQTVHSVFDLRKLRKEIELALKRCAVYRSLYAN
jgi:hypothetical protein